MAETRSHRTPQPSSARLAGVAGRTPLEALCGPAMCVCVGGGGVLLPTPWSQKQQFYNYRPLHFFSSTKFVSFQIFGEVLLVGYI